MEPKSFLAFSIAAALAPVVLSYSISEQELCVITLTATVTPSCPVKAPALCHIDRVEKIFEPVLPVAEEMPFLLRNSAANFFANEYQPRRRDAVQVDQQPWNRALYDLKPSHPTDPDREPPPEHIEPESPDGAIVDPGAMTGQSGGVSSAFGAANAIRQIMATSAQFPAAYEETFIQPWRGNLLITTPAARPEPLEPPDPPHYEQPQELLPASVAVDGGSRLSDWFGPSLSGPRPNFQAGPLGRV